MLPDDELVEIVDRAKRVEWQRDLLTANIDPYAPLTGGVLPLPGKA
jgi:hypothetical protein